MMDAQQGAKHQFLSSKLAQNIKITQKWSRNECKVINGNIEDNCDTDKYVPGMHLYTNHGLRNFEDFNYSFEVTVLEKCSPSALYVKEHLRIQK